MKAKVLGVFALVAVFTACFYWHRWDTKPLREAKFLGDTSSHNIVTYLHGMDVPDISDQELANRRKLDAIGKVLSIKFYLPRSVTQCKQNPHQLCWPQDSLKELKHTLSVISSDDNFAPEDKLKGMIGFSNGGFFTSKLIQYCLLPDTSWVVSIGSAGSWQEPAKDLSHCGRLVSMIGKDDQWHYSYALDFHHYLQSAGAQVALIEFNGGHEMPLKELEIVLSSFLDTNR
ncbi:MAG: hypothetical protein HWE24_08140 [Oceanospirillaceae bacterium]|nr:hypothetical protein [Oceanospirillaceae bacterium]